MKSISTIVNRIRVGIEDRALISSTATSASVECPTLVGTVSPRWIPANRIDAETVPSVRHRQTIWISRAPATSATLDDSVTKTSTSVRSHRPAGTVLPVRIPTVLIIVSVLKATKVTIVQSIQTIVRRIPAKMEERALMGSETTRACVSTVSKANTVKPTSMSAYRIPAKMVPPVISMSTHTLAIVGWDFPE